MSQSRVAIILFACTVLIVGLLAKEVRKSAGAHPGTTGAPGDSTCSQIGCHLDAFVQSGINVNSLKINNEDNPRYQCDSTYSLSLHILDVAAKRFGFEIVALDKNDSSIGTLSVPVSVSAPRVQVITDANRRYVTHTSSSIIPVAPGEDEWQINWKAPADYNGPVTFYYATMGANGNNANSGDVVFLSSKTIYSTTSSVTELNQPQTTLRAWMNQPQTLSIELQDLENYAKTQLSVYDLKGNLLLLQDVGTSGSTTQEIQLNRSLIKGTYLLQLRMQDKVWKTLFLIAS